MTEPGSPPGEVVEAAKQVMKDAFERVVEPVNSRNELMLMVFFGGLVHVGVTTAMLGASFAYAPPDRLDMEPFRAALTWAPSWPLLYGLGGVFAGLVLVVGSGVALAWHRRWLAAVGGIVCTAWSGGHVATMMTTHIALPDDHVAWSTLVLWASWTGVCVLSTTALFGMGRRA